MLASMAALSLSLIARAIRLKAVLRSCSAASFTAGHGALHCDFKRATVNIEPLSINCSDEALRSTGRGTYRWGGILRKPAFMCTQQDVDLADVRKTIGNS